MCWKSYLLRGGRLFAPTIAFIVALSGVLNGQERQPAPDALSRILERLDELEKQNKALLSEIQTLREELHHGTMTATADSQAREEKAEIAEQQITEQAQTKVEASQRFPISLTGMLLFDSFVSKGSNDELFLNTYGDYTLAGSGGGATLSQSIIGLDFRGPNIWGGGRVNGFLSMDFYGGEGSSYEFRIRRGVVSFDWKNRSLTFGQDKSIIAPLQPTSFARVGVPPLSGAGNLWLWRPQVTYEERIPLSPSTKATLQASIFETDESYTAPFLAGSWYVTPDRPAVQARVQVEHTWGEGKKISGGLAGDGSTSHVLGASVPSRVLSADLAVKPLRWLEISGTLLRGKNFANLGGVPGGVTINSGQTVVPIRGSAGWLQASFPVTRRLTFDVYSGRQLNNDRDLSAYGVSKTETLAGNILYRLAPNVVLGLEAARNRVEYLNALEFWANRYDATVAYLF